MNKSTYEGRAAGAFIRALCVSKGKMEAAKGFVESQRWPYRDEIVRTFAAMNQKSAVPAIGTGSGLASTPAGHDFLAALRPLEIVGQLTRISRRPLKTRLLVLGTGAIGTAMPEGLAGSLTAAGYSSVFLTPQRIEAIAVLTEELLRNAESESDQSITNDLAAAVALAADIAFIAPAVSGSVLNGAPAVASTGSTVAAIDADLESTANALITAGSTLANAAWIMAPKTAVHLSLMRSAGFPAYPNVGAKGGDLAGLPVITSAAIAGYVGLIDETQMVLGEDEEIELQYSAEGTLQMAAPATLNSLTPTSANVLSLYQTDSVAVRAQLYRAWYARPGSCAVLTGVSY